MQFVPVSWLTCPCGLAVLGPAGLSSDSGLGGSTDGSTDILVFGSVVDSVTEEGEGGVSCYIVSIKCFIMIADLYPSN